jgi:hypothetical protein
MLAGCMVMWRWENELLNKFLSCILNILQAMCNYHTYRLLLSTAILMRMFNGRERKEGEETARSYLD